MSGERISLEALHDLAGRHVFFDRLKEPDAHKLTAIDRDALLALVEAVERGRRFEREYQRLLGSVRTDAQLELLDSLQSAFIDACGAFEFGGAA